MHNFFCQHNFGEHSANLFWLVIQFSKKFLTCFLFVFIADYYNVLKDLTDEDKKDECIAYAMKLYLALANQNYCRFFSLCNGPKSTCHLLKWFVDREREIALTFLVKRFVLHHSTYLQHRRHFSNIAIFLHF